MIRGIKTFVCDNCGHKFKGLDIEWNAPGTTICGGRSRAASYGRHPQGHGEKLRDRREHVGGIIYEKIVESLLLDDNGLIPSIAF